MSQIDDPERFIELMDEIQERAEEAEQLVNVNVPPGISGIRTIAADLRIVARGEEGRDG